MVALVALVWVVTSRVLPLLEQSVPGDGTRGPLEVGVSPFPVTMQEQYLCLPIASERWRMLPAAGGVGSVVRTPGGTVAVEECRGPFIDSVSLCAALREVGQDTVRLYHEGRQLDCRGD